MVAAKEKIMPIEAEEGAVAMNSWVKANILAMVAMAIAMIGGYFVTVSKLDRLATDFKEFQLTVTSHMNDRTIHRDPERDGARDTEILQTLREIRDKLKGR